MTAEGESKRVLIIDDEPSVTAMLAEGLERLGQEYAIETADCAEEALIKLQRASYALVITDYKLPGSSGLELARTIRRLSPDTQVILMTAYGSSDLQSSAADLKLDAYVEKPFSIAQIREIVRQALQKVRGEASGPRPVEVEAKGGQTSVSEVLQSLRTNSGARCVLLLSVTGYPVEVVGSAGNAELHSISALVAANFVAAEELARLLGNASIFKSSYHEGPNYNIYSYAVSEDLLLAVIFGPESRPGAVWFYTKQAAAHLVPLATEQPSSTARVDDQLIAAVGEELERLFPADEEPAGEERLMSLEEAIAEGVIPSHPWDGGEAE